MWKPCMLEHGFPQLAMANSGSSRLTVPKSRRWANHSVKRKNVMHLSINVHYMRFMRKGYKALGSTKFRPDIWWPLSEYKYSRRKCYGLVLPMVTEHRPCAPSPCMLHVWLGYRYYIGNPIVEVDKKVVVLYIIHSIVCNASWTIDGTSCLKRRTCNGKDPVGMWMFSSWLLRLWLFPMSTMLRSYVGSPTSLRIFCNLWLASFPAASDLVFQ